MPVAVTETATIESLAADTEPMPWKLWLYTNYDCNLRCSYCVAKSGPNVPRRSLGVGNVTRLIDEAVELNFSDVFLTGGEPFLLPDIYDMISYAAPRIHTTVLTNAMLFNPVRLAKLEAVRHPNLVLQVSLDGHTAELHDSYRGKGAWAKAIAGIRTLQEHGFRVKLGTTETPVNSPHIEELRQFVSTDLGIPAEDHFVRPLAKRGFSKEGLELTLNDLLPELTVNLDGIFWHPLSTDTDMQVSKRMFPLSCAVDEVQHTLDVIRKEGRAPLRKFT